MFILHIYLKNGSHCWNGSLDYLFQTVKNFSIHPASLVTTVYSVRMGVCVNCSILTTTKDLKILDETPQQWASTIPHSGLSKDNDQCSIYMGTLQKGKNGNQSVSTHFFLCLHHATENRIKKLHIFRQARHIRISKPKSISPTLTN